MHVGQSYIMFCVSLETRVWKAELQKIFGKGCCYILNNRYPWCEWSSLAFVLHVLSCSTRVVGGLGGLYISANNILFCIQNVVKYLLLFSSDKSPLCSVINRIYIFYWNTFSILFVHHSFVLSFIHLFSLPFFGNFVYSFIHFFTLSFIFLQ
jgi:hypothetical protein